ncbi:hypothetical protein [Burkholderia sp. Ac-20344]|uniref:hypothetical protein n=1 Tax=Burkholderia sp. Ac-20344 TaxID=2703890 RepID=UPI001F11CC1E|nr:hypothetical protein [Burkholderia sp. Ac-20344]
MLAHSHQISPFFDFFASRLNCDDTERLNDSRISGHICCGHRYGPDGTPASAGTGRSPDEREAVLANGFVGTSSTPSVTGVSKLTANYALPTTLTNLMGGIDGQSVKIVATNGNCTVADNANLQTTTGANVVMATGQVLTFTFDAE